MELRHVIPCYFLSCMFCFCCCYKSVFDTSQITAWLYIYIYIYIYTYIYIYHGVHVCVCFNQKGDIPTLNGGSLKLVDKFTYHRNSVSSTENDINVWLAKAWTPMDRLSIIWKSDLSDEIKHNFFSKQRSCQFFLMDGLHGRWLCVKKKSLTGIAQECYELYWTNPGSNSTQNNSCSATYLLSLKPSK